MGSHTGTSWLLVLNRVTLPNGPPGPSDLTGRTEGEGQGAIKPLGWVDQLNVMVMINVPKYGLEDT